MATGKKTSIKDIAREAGVSPTLVSFVMNGKQKKYRVSDAMADKIKDIAACMGYIPNGFAKSLRDGTSHTIGVIVSDISNPFSSYMVKNIEITAEEHGYMALFASSDEKSYRLDSLATQMLSKEVDGIILVPCAGSEQTVQMIVNKGVPIVLLDRYIPNIKTNYVCLDNNKAGEDATKYLQKKGYKNISLVCYDFDVSNMQDRIAGYTAAMTSAGLEHNISVEYVDINELENSCEKAMKKIKEDGTQAIIFATNSIAAQCLKIIQREGIRVPEDLGLICFDGGSEFDFFYSPLTYISQPLEKMAIKAVEMLLELIDTNDALTLQLEMAGSLVEQSSTKYIK